MSGTKSRPRQQMTDEQRERWNAYNRNYRRQHPDKVKKWQDGYIMRKAERLRAELEAGGHNAGA